MYVADKYSYKRTVLNVARTALNDATKASLRKLFAKYQKQDEMNTRVYI